MEQRCLLLPDHSKDAKLQSDSSNSNIQNNIGVETKDTLENNVGVNGNDGSESSTDHEVTDLVKENEQDTNNQTHNATTSNTNPERLLLAIE